MRQTVTEKQLLKDPNNNVYCQDYIIPEDLISKHKDRVNWEFISRYQNLSEDFITKHKDLVSWYQIFHCQKLSEKFITKHKERKKELVSYFDK